MTHTKLLVEESTFILTVIHSSTLSMQIIIRLSEEDVGLCAAWNKQLQTRPRAENTSLLPTVCLQLKKKWKIYGLIYSKNQSRIR